MEEKFEPVADGDSRVSSYLFQLRASKTQADMLDHRFAPKTPGSLYVRLSGDSQQSLLSGVISKAQYVSVALLMEMQKEELDWDKMKYVKSSELRQWSRH